LSSNQNVVSQQSRLRRKGAALARRAEAAPQYIPG